MRYQVIVSNEARKNLKKIPIEWKRRVWLYLDRLKTDPYIGKKLEGRYAGSYSIRVWPYRIIYTIKKKELIIEVIEIEHRGGAYKK